MKGILMGVVLLGTSSMAPFAHAADFTAQRSVPFAEDSIVAGNIKRECEIATQLPAALVRFAAEGGHRVELQDTPDTASGQVVKMEIHDAQSAGNAWMGHHKSVTVKGSLYRDGQQVAKFVARRNSRGGFGAGFKGSCAVLERTVNAIGKDVAGWLNNPSDGAQLGDLR
ncbi:hypothetical protein [Pseudoxanthomonas sp. Root630]|uniref:hypothetical protein n=1 Tax=Pseudoxanthomonas sp. Root630 TaxID=1736574 RepID=UPI0012DC2365|nr:hypothetical protein [Pseudoxanthomonas sp. Root630]